MSPSSDNLLRKLLSSSATERLEAARYFADHATIVDERWLREAAARESVLWIKGALRRAIARISPTPASETTGVKDVGELPDGFASQVFADALETTSSQLLHEIEPLLGTLRLSAESEIADFARSETRKNLDRLGEFLGALSRLRRAASAPKIEEFALDETVTRCVQDVAAENVPIKKIGTIPCVVEGDPILVALCISNGLRNAIEATIATGQEVAQLPVTIAWGSTDVDYWVSIVDVGIGFKGILSKAFEIGTTTKAGHLGMGLAITGQAMTSMRGQAALIPNDHGVRFEMRWSKKTG